MYFEWDERKNRANIKKHGFDFADAAEMFHGILLARPDPGEEYGEDRWIGIGVVKSRVAVVAFVERPPDGLRIISLRKASREERKQYEEALRHGLEAG